MTAHPFRAMSNPMGALIAALDKHAAAEPDDVPGAVMARWCDRQDDLLRDLAETKPVSVHDLLTKVGAAFDRLLFDDGADPLRLFLPAERELFEAAAADVRTALKHAEAPT